MALFGRSKTVLGLDIGSHSIKAIILDKTKTGMVLSNVGMVNLPPEAIVDGTVEEKDIVITAIKNLTKLNKVKIKQVSTSVSGYSVIIKKISLPRSTKEELAENIEVEAEQFIPFDISEVNVDFQILGSEDELSDQMEVVLVAAKKEVIDNYMEILVEANLKPTVVDVDVFALENAFTHNYPDLRDTVCLIDIGANKMNINILRDGMSLLTKDAALGGARITAEIQDLFDVDYQTAESIKVGGMEAPDPAALEEIVGRAANNWIAEVKRTIDYLEASYPNEELSEIYLSGGSMRIKGLDALFEKELGVTVNVFNPFKEIGINQNKFDPDYIEYLAPQTAICLGLALRMGEEI